MGCRMIGCFGSVFEFRCVDLELDLDLCLVVGFEFEFVFGG